MRVVFVATVVRHPYFAAVRLQVRRPIFILRGGIDVDAHKNRRIGGDSFLNPLGEAHVNVGRSGHKDGNAVTLQSRLTVLGNGEGEVFLFKAIPNRATVPAAMPWIESHHESRIARRP